MSEPSGWTAPGTSGPPPPPGQAPPAGPAGQQVPPSGGWGEPHRAPGSPAWAARAPRPGIVPLRPLSLGELWDGAFQAVRTNAGPLLGSAAVIVVVMTAAQVALQAVLSTQLAGSLEASLADPAVSSEQLLTDLGAALPGLLGGSLLSAVLTLVAVAALTGVVTVSVSTAVLGRRTAARELWRRVRSRLVALTAVALVVALVPGLATLVLLAPGFALLVSGAVGGSDGALVGGLAVLLLGTLGAVALGLLLTVRLFLAPAALVLEGAGVGRSLRRAWGLSRRGFWRLLGIYLLTTACVLITAVVVAVPFQVIATVAGSLVGADSPLFLPVNLGVTAVGTALVSTVLYPLQAAVTALQYIDQRMRQEGLDVELARSAAQ